MTTTNRRGRYRSVVAINSDSRIRQAKALIDDARCLAVDILEETDCPPLDDARHYLNWALLAFDRADIELGTKGGNGAV
jgi:hypothetical protein